MPLTWQKEDYFSLLMSNDKRSFTALEMLVDDLHSDKEKTVNKFLCHSGSEDFLWGLVRLLGNDTARVAGNAAYILGTLAESELGCMRVLSLGKDGSAESRKILPDLTRMLTFDDSESVMNAAGTMGTLAESHEGREWILGEKCLPQTLEYITALLHSENLWTASNAALVLARLSISEYGCTQMLDHEHSQHILSKLIMSLGVDEAGRGMNAAFAIGRLCDMDQGRKRLLLLGDSERMISSLAKMLSCDDTGASKNACFALSCLATNSEGHFRLLSNVHSDDILKTLATLLNTEDSETGWFAAMTLRTLASQPKGCLRLRDHPQVVPGLKNIEAKTDVNVDLKEEAIITLEILKRLPKPSVPIIQVVSSNTIQARWDPIVTKSGFQVRYQLFDGTKCVYTGKQCECEVAGLHANTAYIYKVRAYTEGDESPFSDIVSIITEESVPGPPQSVRILGATITQLKIGWEPPDNINGVLKGYYIYLGDKEVQHTMENNVILTGLTVNTTYDIEVCAATVKGRGERNGTTGTTAELGAHAPSKPHVNVIGRNELYVSWGAPEVPLGRLNRYDVIMNDKIIYSGSDLNLPVRRLTPDTEYCFVIVALTSEGKFESKMTKKRTAKDEYDSARPPLYQTPKKEGMEDGNKTPTNSTQPQSSSTTPHKRRKSSANRISSAKASAKRVGTGKERSKSSAGPSGELRPNSAASSILSSQEAVVEKSPTPQSVEQPPAPASIRFTTSPSPGKPIAEVKYEPPRPVSKTRPVRTQNKVERNNNGSAKVQQTVALSTVSMQSKKSEENKTPDTSVNVKRSGIKSDVKEPHSAGNGMKIERSKTMVTGRELKRGKYSSNTQNHRAGSETKLPDSAERSRSNNNDKGQSSGIQNREGTRTKGGDFDIRQDFLTGTGERGKILAASHNVAEKSNSKMSNHHGGRTKDKSTNRDLPKPSPPSQKYLLEGQGGIHADSPWGPRSIISPRSSRDGGAFENQDSDWLTQVKRVSENYSRSMQPSNLIPNPADSTYYIDSSQFLQRTNTYINSHRRQLLESLPNVASKRPAIRSHPTLPSITSERKLNDRRRPLGRRSLEKLQKSNPEMKASMPLKLGQSINFEVDIPDTSSKLSNKFIPMQLRTQPANLGIGQLQRVNTTLLAENTDNSISFRRLEALTRSQTQIELRNQQSLSNVAPDNRRDLGLMMAKEREKASPTRKNIHSGSSQKVQKLGQPGSSHQRHKEPDSMLLQQSWGLNSSQDLASLQNVR